MINWQEYAPQAEPAAFTRLRLLAGKLKRRFPHVEYEDIYQDAALALVAGARSTQRIEGACIDKIRQVFGWGRKPVYAHDIEENYGAQRTTKAPETLVIEEERIQLVRAAVAALPMTERVVIEQHYYQGVPFYQVGKNIGRSVVTVSQYHRRALLHLRKTVHNEEE